jgi:hypothetical protein
MGRLARVLNLSARETLVPRQPMRDSPRDAIDDLVGDVRLVTLLLKNRDGRGIELDGHGLCSFCRHKAGLTAVELLNYLRSNDYSRCMVVA